MSAQTQGDIRPVAKAPAKSPDFTQLILGKLDKGYFRENTHSSRISDKPITTVDI
jgi:hypothetical protein